MSESKYKSENPFKAFQIRWNEPLGKDECPYAYRWVLNLGLFSIRIHQWIRSDDKRYFHDHPWWFITLVLKGGYTDVSTDGEDKLTVGSIRYRPSNHKHYVRVPERGAWTLLLTGPQNRNWGFWVNGKFKRPWKFFPEWGHPPCDEQ